MLTVDIVDVHAEGGPSRVVTSAAALVQGETMAERLDYCRANLAGLRKLLLHEPRGYPSLCAILVLPPVEEGSHFGIIIVQQGGYTPMSGSNLMAAVTAVLEEGIVPAVEPVTALRIDTAVGTVTVDAEVRDGRVLSVTIANVPSYVVALDHPLEVPTIGVVPTDVLFGGQFFAQVRAADLGLDIHPSNGRELARLGAMIKLAADEQVPVRHPENPAIADFGLVLFHTGGRVPERIDRNVAYLTNGPLRRDDPTTWTGALTRDPCGTGTSARMAAMHARGQLGLHEDFVHHSIIGGRFVGRLTGTTTVGGVDAVLPTISGRSWITGRGQLVVDDSDPFPEGFTVGDLWGPQPD